MPMFEVKMRNKILIKKNRRIREIEIYIKEGICEGKRDKHF